MGAVVMLGATSQVRGYEDRKLAGISEALEILNSG